VCIVVYDVLVLFFNFLSIRIYTIEFVQVIQRKGMTMSHEVDTEQCVLLLRKRWVKEAGYPLSPSFDERLVSMLACSVPPLWCSLSLFFLWFSYARLSISVVLLFLFFFFTPFFAHLWLLPCHIHKDRYWVTISLKLIMLFHRCRLFLVGTKELSNSFMN
jgi:hypothetical protein